jgi:hypothetical protein
LELIGVGFAELGFAGTTDGAVLDGETVSVGLDTNTLLVHGKTSFVEIGW